MKKIFLLIAIFCVSNVFSQKSIKNENSQYTKRILSEKKLVDPSFKNSLTEAEFMIPESVEISSSDFPQYIDTEDGAFTTLKVVFQLEKDTPLTYSGIETWKKKNKEIKGYAFTLSSGARLLFQTNSNGFNPSLLEYVNEGTQEKDIFYIKNNNIKIVYKDKIKTKKIKL